MELAASYHQERLWFIDRFEAGNLYEAAPVYHNIPLILNINGPLDIPRLEQSIRRVIQRHEVLRTRLIGRSGQPIQHIEPDPRFELQYQDRRHPDARLKLPEAVELAVEESQRPFKLDQERLIRGKLIHRAEGQFLLVLTIHHLAADRTSLAIITREIFDIYQARLKGQEVSMPAPPLQYKDFSQWQRQIPASRLKPSLLYWKTQLRSPLQALELPTDRRRAAIHLFAEGRLPFCLSPSLGPEVTALARDRKVDPFAVMLSAFIVLLHRYSGQEEMVVGRSEPNRSQPGTEKLVGPVANLVALRIRLHRQWRLYQLLAHVQQTAAEAHRYRAVPFDHLVSQLNPRKDMSRTALFDVLFQYEEEPPEQLELAELTVQIEETNLGWGKYDLNMLIQPRQKGFVGLLVYNAQYYDRWRIERLSQHYRRVLEQLVENRDCPLSRVRLLNEDEEAELLYRWSGEYRQAGYPTEATIADLFCRQVSRRPAVVALKGPQGCQLSYGELNRRADCISGGLRRRGIGPDWLVALLLERSLETVAAVIGVVKAAGGYLPIDPTYPEERIGFMLADTRAAVVLTGCHLVERVQTLKPPGIEICCLEDIVDSVPPAALPSPHSLFPSSLAYVIYTSGTTGRPRGVAVNHKQVVRLFVNDHFQFDFSHRDVWTLFHSYCFDFSVWEMYGALLSGGQLVVVAAMVARDTDQYRQLLGREGVTVLNQTPSAFYRLMDEELGCRRAELRLKYVIFGGEALNPSKLEEWRRRYPETALINMFGITETTVHVTYKEIGEEEIGSGVSNIGKPIPTLGTYVLDEHRALVPVGVVGEVYVEGDGLARGYVNRPELTADKFAVVVLQPGKSARRLYRTGDLARFLANGDLQYMGRSDHQVQIRGFRIEPAEIESRLLQHGSVKEAVVLARDGGDNDRHLVAYVVTGPGDKTRRKKPSQWRQFLSRSLPDYMIPAYFVQLDHIPLTANGKVDRTALPEPTVQLAHSHVPPRDELEDRLALIWSTVLGVDKAQLGIDSDFFELGGHSLKATILTSWIHRELDVRVPLAEIFSHPTLAGISAFIRRAGVEKYAAIAPVEKREYYPLSSAQQRLYILQQMEPQMTTYNIFAAFELTGSLDVVRIRQACREVIRRHESLRTLFRLLDGGPVQQVRERLDFDIEYHESGEAARVMGAFVRAFDLACAPLLRVGVIEGAESKYVLMVDMHHIIADGTSLGVLVADFMSLYEGQEPGSLRIQYKDYAQWQRQESGGESRRRQQAFWFAQLQGELPVLNLPYDYPRPPVQSFAGSRLSFEVDEEEAAGLKSLAARQEVTLFMLLLSVYTLLLSKLCGQEDVPVGTPIAGRRHADLESIVGMFVNTLVMRNFPRSDRSFAEFLGEVKERTLQAFDNQEYQFEDLVEDLAKRIKRDVSRNPLFDTMFALQNMDIREIEIPGLTLRPYEVENRASRFDLFLQGFESADRLIFRLEYNTDLFRQDTIERFITYFRSALSAVAVDSQQRLSDVEILSTAERHRVLVEFNRSAVDYPHEQLIHRLLAEQAARRPDRIALTASHHLSYRELAHRVQRLARQLYAEGVRPDTIVGFMAERCPEMIIGIIGILKAGGAYLPIDPHFPQERVQYMLKDSGAGILLDSAHLLNREPGKGDHPHLPSVSADSLAYCIYTSGSTGRPKGVMVRHRSLMNLLAALADTYPFGPADTYLLKTSFLFDVSVTELFGWIMGGGRLVVLNPEGEKDPPHIRETVQREQVSHINFVPAMFQAFTGMLTAANVRQLSSLKYIFLAGEALPPELVAQFERRRGDLKVRLENLYGPTEATVYASGYSLPARLERGGIPIGRPVANTQLYILDKHEKVQPPGVPGELFIGGCGLAVGYLNNPELTADKFIHAAAKTREDTRSPKNQPLNPKSQILYRTGDLARFLPDGNIEFLGRLDRQVKIRGFRIELGEIENQLAGHPLVKEAAVVDRQKGDGEKYLCAYIVPSVPDKTGEMNPVQWRQYLGQMLPDYMIPAYFIAVDELPLTSSGKVDRKSLPDMRDLEPTLREGRDYAAPTNDMEAAISEIWKEVLETAHIGIDENFFDIGGNSLNLLRVNQKLNTLLKKQLPVMTLFRHTTVRSLAQFLSGHGHEQTLHSLNRKKRSIAIRKDRLEIAVIGMAGRFPGARDVETFWENLKEGLESISFFSDEELADGGGESRLATDAQYVRASGYLEGIEYFDAGFFGYNPREADTMDPQMRIFHECAWNALEDAGYNPDTYEGAIGLYAGATANLYWSFHVHLSGKADQLGAYAAMQLTNKDYLATMVSYRLNLKGPAVIVQSACSTSLVAIHLAGQAITNGECDMALAGGVTVIRLGKTGYLYQEGMILSPDGHCRAFDEKARGTVSGSGVGLVVLKCLESALADGDHVYAVVKGSAINNDGVRRIGFSAPSVEGEAEVIHNAREMAGVEPESITYIETHGTGTELGDPVEIEALRLALATSQKGFCALGSAKSNVGHLDAAAGAAGFIKTVLALHHRLIPPTLHFESPNPRIDFEQSPFYVNRELKEWPDSPFPRRAGVSSFGLGGTNAHVILEEYRPDESRGGSRNLHLLLLSARSEDALRRMAANLVEFFKKNPRIELADVAYTLQVGRKPFGCRKAMLCATAAEAIEHLSCPSSERVFTHIGQDGRQEPSVIFMFPGQGAQYVNMAGNLYETERIFRQEMDRCFRILSSVLELDIKKMLYLSPEGIDRTEVAQPLIFAVEYALARLLMAWGIQPFAMIGHSIGEYVAACLSGVFSIDDALKVVALRGELMQRMAMGAMLSVPLSEAETMSLLESYPDLSLAAVNSTGRCVVSGSHEAVEALARQLKKGGCESRPLNTSHAFHSRMMEPILGEFEHRLAEMGLKQTVEIPYISNVTGTWANIKEAASPHYWATHIRNTVRFGDGIGELLKRQPAIFVEVGPGRTLSAFVQQHRDRQANHKVVDLLNHRREEDSDTLYLLKKLGHLWGYGVNIDWRRFYKEERRRRLSLPGYPFQGQRFQLEAAQLDIDRNRIQQNRGPSALLHADEPGEEDAVSPANRPELSTPYAAPRTETEAQMVRIWQQFLGITPLGIHDNFFELGSDSLKMMTISAKIHKELNIKIPLTEFYNRPTIEKLAEYVAAAGQYAYVRIQALEKREYYALSSAQKRLYLFQQMEPAAVAYNLLEVVVLEGEVSLEKLEEVFSFLIRRHESFRTSFITVKGEPVQRVHDRVDFEIEYTKHGSGRDDSPERLIRDFVRPFDLSMAPLSRVGLMGIAEERFLLMVDMHHIISDGASTEILVREFYELYEGREPAPLSVQYKDYAAWENRRLMEGKFNSRRNYWLRRLDGFSLTRLSPDKRGSYRRISGNKESLVLKQPTTERIENFCIRYGVTRSTFMMMVFEVVLAHELEQWDITTGTPVSLRQDPCLQNLVGIFLNILVVRTIIDPEASFLDNLAKKKETMARDLHHRDYPFELLHYGLKDRGDIEGDELLSILFNYFPSGGDLELSARELKLLPYDWSEIEPKYDMTLYLYDTGTTMRLNLVYKSNLYVESTIQSILSGMAEVIDRVLEEGNAAIGSLVSLRAEEDDEFYSEFAEYYENE